MYNWHARLKRNRSKGFYMIRELVTDEELLAGIPDKPEGAPDCFGGDETSDACIDCDYAEACEQACYSGAYITDDGTEEAADGE